MSSVDAVEPDRQMATIVRVTSIEPIIGADRIVLAKILGWQCVVKKDDFKVDDMAIYFSIDSILDPADPNMSFLEGKRLKTIKLRGVLSQGLLAPLKWLVDRGHSIDTLTEGDNVTSLLGVTKYVSSDEIGQYMKSDVVYDDRIKFPEFIRKTDEPRLQNMTRLLDGLKDVPFIVTRKEDGQSGTFYLNNDHFGICTRQFEWLENVPNASVLFSIAAKYQIEDNLRKYGKNIAIQGEVIGPKINGNKLNVSSHVFKVFNIWDIESQRYLDWADVKTFCTDAGLLTVPELTWTSSDLTLDAFLAFADSIEYDKGDPAEGIVVKTDGWPRVSFKVISNKFLLKHDK